jgi:cystathionine beta-lyase/cystathionine gamma-synthase
MTRSLRFDTLAIHGGVKPEPVTGAIMTPIFATSTYAQPELGVNTGYEYARVSNPTRTALEESLAALEGAAHGLCFASGMAAVSTMMGFFSQGDHLVVSENTYGGVYRVFELVFRNFGLEFTWVRSSDLREVAAAFRPNTRMLYLETPTNPMMEVTDIAGAAAIAKAHGALTAVDNTFMTPYFQRPLEHGADLVLHSTTKYLNGHSDSVGGALLTSDGKLCERLRLLQKSVGAILSPFDAFLVLRGLKTLGVRMRQHETNGNAVATLLASHPKVRAVHYPGLPASPGHAVHARQAKGFGAMVAFDLGGLEEARRFLNALEVFALAESLGGVESLACHPASMTHAAVPQERRDAMGITAGLVRLSVGIEDVQDLLDDVGQALDKV